MSDYGVYTEPGTIRFERTLPGPIERVWAYLTESEKRRTWLASGTMELRVGGKVALHFMHSEITPHQEVIPDKYKDAACGGGLNGQVTQCAAPRLLSFTWGDEPTGNSEVTFELSPRGKDVLLVITHRRLTDVEQMVSVSGGWHAHVDILIARLNEQTPPPFWSAHAKLEAHYAEVIRKDSVVAASA